MISGESAGRWIGPMGRALRGQLQRPFVRQKIASFTIVPNPGDLAHIAELAYAGSLTPVVDRTCSLEETADAIAHVEQGHTARQGRRRRLRRVPIDHYRSARHARVVPTAALWEAPTSATWNRRRKPSRS